jgi:hypothetical protein
MSTQNNKVNLIITTSSLSPGMTGGIFYQTGYVNGTVITLQRISAVCFDWDAVVFARPWPRSAGYAPG